MLRRLALGLAALFVLSLGAAPALAQPSGISQKVGVCDPKTAANCLKPAADGSIPVTGTFTISNYALETGGNLAASKTDLDALVAAAANPAGILGTNGTTIASPTNGLDVTVRGAAASGATVAGNPLLNGCRAATTAPTAVTDGQAVAMECGVEGRLVTAPYAIKDIQVRGSTGAITNTTQTSIIASAGGSLRNYITAIQCANSGATTSILTFTDDATTVLINPAGGGGSWTFPVPLRTAAATAFQVTPGSSSSSQYCSAQGFTGL